MKLVSREPARDAEQRFRVTYPPPELVDGDRTRRGGGARHAGRHATKGAPRRRRSKRLRRSEFSAPKDGLEAEGPTNLRRWVRARRPRRRAPLSRCGGG